MEMNEVSTLSLCSINGLNSEPVASMDSNRLQKQRDEINQFIQENYRSWISNVDQLDEAQIICLGEMHDVEMHRMINAQIIDMLYEQESILLVEKSTQEINENLSLSDKEEDAISQAKYVRQPIQVDGWDIEDDEIRIKELGKYVRACMIYEEPKVIHFLSYSKTTRLYEDLENNRLSTCSRIAKIVSFGCRLSCTALFVKTCKPCIKKYYKAKARQGLQKIINGCLLRNQRMCEVIQDVSENYKKVFVMAGQAHFEMIEKETKGIDYGPSNKAVKLTMDFLSTKKFAILIPKGG